MIRLSERLYAAAKLTGKSRFVADVGCDHGYLGIYLLENGLTDHVCAMDVHSGPLERARENAESAGVSDRMDFILSDGLKELKEPYAEKAVILGMGGALIYRILKEAPDGVRAALRACVLGPQSEQELFRRQLLSLRLIAVNESHVIEDGKYYPLILVRPEADLSPEEMEGYELRSTAEYTYGRIGLERRDEVLRLHILKNREVFSRLLQGRLPELRRRQLRERYETAVEALKTYYGVI